MKEKESSLASIQSKIWKVWDIFRAENIRIEDYYVGLLFLSLQKEGLLKDEFQCSGSDFYESLEESIQNSDKEFLSQYLPVISAFETTIKNFTNDGLAEITQAFNELNSEFLSENFSEIFDHILYRISMSQGRHGGEIVQPLELTRLLMNLADLPPNARVFNPFAGLASFGVFLEQGQEYFGQELDKKTWALGQLRLMAYNRTDSSQFICENSVENWPNPDHKFDLIISHPPFLSFSIAGKRDQKQIEAPRHRLIEQFLVDNGIKSLNQNGKLIAILPQGFLFLSINRGLREYLVNKNLLDTIISLPSGILSNTGVSVVILVINLNKNQDGLIRFIDGKYFAIGKNRNEKLLNYTALKELAYDPYVNSEFVRIATIDQIRENDYNLNLPRYFQKSIEGIKLRELLEPIRGNYANTFLEGRLVRNRDLKDDKVDFNLEISNIETAELRTPNIKEINKSCLLLAIRWKTLKPTWFEYANEPIYLRIGDILPYTIREELVDKAYLISELHSEYVKEQLDSYRIGGTIPMIRRDDLLEVVLKLPSMEEQRAKIQGIEELSGKIKVLEKERKALVLGKTIDQFNEFASLKHTLGRPRQNILDWTDNLLHFLSAKREGFDDLNKAFLEFYETDIISALKEIKRDVNFMTDILEKGENGFVVQDFDKTIIPLSDVNSLINDLSSNSFNFKIKKLLLKGEILKERGVQGNKTLLRTLIDNLLTNAHKYGFDKNAVGNEVVFELKEVDDFLFLEVRNNGKPFPKNFDRDKFITKYSTANSKSGTGLGGYDIHRIAVEFNNPDWELVLNDDLIYPVKFKFQFPIKLIN